MDFVFNDTDADETYEPPALNSSNESDTDLPEGKF